MSGPASLHYNSEYFAWQEKGSEFGGWANLFLFAPHIRPSDRVLDFGCGGGHLLANIQCREKMGIEVNAAAREYVESLGIPVVSSVSEIPDHWGDVIISNHALEHCAHPLLELRGLHRKLRPGGSIVFVVPCESFKLGYRTGDMNHHLYSWSPMAIANLFTEAGFEVEESKAFMYKWPPYYEPMARIFGRRLFHVLCRLYAWLDRSWVQVRIVAHRGPDNAVMPDGTAVGVPTPTEEGSS